MIALKSTAVSVNGVCIHEIDEGIFRQRYCLHCLDFSCADMCCTYGCRVDVTERDRLLSYARELEPKLGIPASGWFQDYIIEDADYPSSKAVRTQVKNDKCVFNDQKLRGCFLHRFAAGLGLDRHTLKPMICALFPLGWEEGRLLVDSLLEELPCNEHGVSVFEAQKEELGYYFGRAFVSQLQDIASHTDSKIGLGTP